jgi:hypothetical protein
MSHMICKLALPLVFATACCGQQSLSNRYDFQDVNYPNSIYSVPLGMNNHRVVAGTFIDVTGVFHGYVWDAGKFTKVDYPGAFGTTAGGINDRGDLAGTFLDAQGFQHGYKLARPELCGLVFDDNDAKCKPVFKAIDFPGAAQTRVEFELGPGLGTAGIGINNFGEVTGMYATSGQYSNGFVEFLGSYVAIDNPLASHRVGDGSKCFTVSNIGVLACDYQTQASKTAPQITHGFLRDGSTDIPIEFPGSAKEGFGTQISGVNIFNVAVGVYFDGKAFNAMLWQDGKFFTVNFPNTPYNELHSINDRGDVSGAYDTDPSGQVLHGFVAFLKP